MAAADQPPAKGAKPKATTHKRTPPKKSPRKTNGTAGAPGTTASGAAPRRRRSKANKAAFALAMEVANAQDIPVPTGLTTKDVVELVMDRSVQTLRWAMAETDKIEPDKFWKSTIAGPVPDERFQLEQRLRREVFDMATKVIDLDKDAPVAPIVVNLQPTEEKALQIAEAMKEAGLLE